jgi:hypothetical protein
MSIDLTCYKMCVTKLIVVDKITNFFMAVKYEDLQLFKDPKSVENKETLQDQFNKWEALLDQNLINGWRTVAYNDNPYLTIPYSQKTPELVDLIIQAYQKAGWCVKIRTDDEEGKKFLQFTPASDAKLKLTGIRD